MESDCRIPVVCCRPRVLLLHALFWGLVSLRLFITVSFPFLLVLIGVLMCFRVFGASLLSTDRPSGTLRAAATLVEQF